MEHIWTYVLAGGAWLLGRIPKVAHVVAAEAVAYAEKYYADGHLSDAELEAIAVDYAGRHAKWLPAPVVRYLIREICRRRKAARERERAEAA